MKSLLFSAKLLSLFLLLLHCSPCTLAWTLSNNSAVADTFARIVISFPEIISVDELGNNITIYGLTCQGVRVASLSLDQIPVTQTDGALNVSGSLLGIGLQCLGNYTMVRDSSGREKARGLVFLALSGSSIDLGMWAGRKDPGQPLPLQATTTFCNTTLLVSNLTITGGRFQSLVPLIVAAIENLAAPLVCAELTQLIDVNFTAVLNSAFTSTLAPLASQLHEYQSSPMFGESQTIIASTLCGLVWCLYVIVFILIKWTRMHHHNMKSAASGFASQSQSSISNAALNAPVTRTTMMHGNDEYLPLLSDKPHHYNNLNNNQNLHDPNSNNNSAIDPTSPSYSHALALSPKVSSLYALLVPLLLLANIALFLSSNLSVGASVYVSLTWGLPPDSPRVQLPSIFSFTLANSVVDMWHAGVYPLSILIACFSGFWPYCKLLLMLMCWWFPVRWLPVRRRERVLIALDALGKWSLVDSYVLVLMLVAFRLKLPVGPVFVDVFVQSDIGFYTFLLATIASLLLTHVTLALHRHAEDLEFPLIADKMAEPESLARHRFGLDWDQLCRCTPFGSAAFVLVLVVSGVMLGVGSAVDAFAFTFLGLVGDLMRGIGLPTTNVYSVLSLAMDLPDATFYDPAQFGIHAIQACFLLWTFAMPLAHIFLLLVMWLVPMKPIFQRRLFVVVEIFNAWSALEVFVASILAALLELEQFAEFIVGTNCDALDDALQAVFHLDKAPSCFAVKATLQWGCGVLFTAAALYFVFSTIAMRMAHKALRERLDAAYTQHLSLSQYADLQVDHRVETARQLKNQAQESCWNSTWRNISRQISLCLAPLGLISFSPRFPKSVDSL